MFVIGDMFHGYITFMTRQAWLWTVWPADARRAIQAVPYLVREAFQHAMR